MRILKRSIFGDTNYSFVAPFNEESESYEFTHAGTRFVFNKDDFPKNGKFLPVNKNYRFEDYGDVFEVFLSEENDDTQLLLFNETHIPYVNKLRERIFIVGEQCL